MQLVQPLLPSGGGGLYSWISSSSLLKNVFKSEHRKVGYWLGEAHSGQAGLDSLGLGHELEDQRSCRPLFQAVVSQPTVGRMFANIPDEVGDFLLAHLHAHSCYLYVVET